MVRRKESDEQENINLSDAIDELIARERMHFEQNLILMVKDLGREVKDEINYARKKLDSIERKLTKSFKK